MQSLKHTKWHEIFVYEFCSWSALKDQMDDMLSESDRKGIMVPRVRKINRKTSVYTYPLPECRCLQESLVNKTIDHNVDIPDNYSLQQNKSLNRWHDSYIQKSLHQIYIIFNSMALVFQLPVVWLSEVVFSCQDAGFPVLITQVEISTFVWLEASTAWRFCVHITEFI